MIRRDLHAANSGLRLSSADFLLCFKSRNIRHSYESQWNAHTPLIVCSAVLFRPSGKSQHFTIRGPQKFERTGEVTDTNAQMKNINGCFSTVFKPPLRKLVDCLGQIKLFSSYYSKLHNRSFFSMLAEDIAELKRGKETGNCYVVICSHLPLK